MAVTREDVIRVAELARLGMDAERAEELTRELSSILAHMEVLSQVETAGVATTEGDEAIGTPLRPDVGVVGGMAGTVESFAPSMRDGFFIVPRLATHEDQPENAA
ncbi:MAG TPA: Asp-tRNA(Asn)/Glu-tRNA(Gln) amidotransferase subunit GatC [Gemmatimonadaceae bacterium]|nr:Asp-tRNA(Asn)/Glu-tRNA(Gln) amidotransferase subunit GatC [Gemmatimonadaceae bacterium]